MFVDEHVCPTHSQQRESERNMGYTANSVDVDFHVPADQVADALAALNDWDRQQWPDRDGLAWSSLCEAMDDGAGFTDSEQTDAGFSLGYHNDTWFNAGEEMLGVLGPFAREGSYVRLIGEEDTLFGFRVVDGVLLPESGEFTWRVDRALPTP